MKIAFIPGDGIGPEVLDEALRVLDTLRRFGFNFDTVSLLAGGCAYEKTGSPLPKLTLDAAREVDAILFGPVGDARFDALDRTLRPERAIVGLREQFGLCASLRHVRIDLPLIECSPLRAEVARGVDLMIVRELAGDVYMGTPRGQRIATDGYGAGTPEGFDTMRYSRSEIERIAHIAFQIAQGRRRRLLSVDKANVLETSRLWRETVSAVASSYRDVELTHQYADTASMALVATPARFDTVLAPNLFGDLLTDIASALTGSVALSASAIFGENGNFLFEPGHGSAPDIAGSGRANPLSSIRAAALLLRYAAKRVDLAERVESAVQTVLNAGLRTDDLYVQGATRVSTREMGDAVVRALTSPKSG